MADEPTGWSGRDELDDDELDDDDELAGVELLPHATYYIDNQLSPEEVARHPVIKIQYERSDDGELRVADVWVDVREGGATVVERDDGSYEIILSYCDRPPPGRPPPPRLPEPKDRPTRRARPLPTVAPGASPSSRAFARLGHYVFSAEGIEVELSGPDGDDWGEATAEIVQGPAGCWVRVLGPDGSEDVTGPFADLAEAMRSVADLGPAEEYYGWISAEFVLAEVLTERGFREWTVNGRGWSWGRPDEWLDHPWTEVVAAECYEVDEFGDELWLTTYECGPFRWTSNADGDVELSLASDGEPFDSWSLPAAPEGEDQSWRSGPRPAPVDVLCVGPSSLDWVVPPVADDGPDHR
jgi:hypothetical protein